MVKKDLEKEKPAVKKAPEKKVAKTDKLDKKEVVKETPKKKKLKLKKKPLIIMGLVVLVFALFLLATTFHKSDYKKEIVNEPEVQEPAPEPEPEVHYDIKAEYPDTDLVAILNIPNTTITKEPVVQTTNNSFYLNRDIHKKKDIIGTTFLDYRVNVDDSKKILIYGHNSPTLNPPFKQLEKYYKEDYALNNREIKLTTTKAEYTFEIFSVYIDANELSNFSYMNINFDSDAAWASHINQLKNNSWYDFGTEVSADDRILVVQTCTYHSKYSKYKNKRFVLIAKQVGKVDNTI